MSRTDSISDVMTTDLATVPRNANVREAAAMMRDREIGDVLVMDDGELCGILTDRDIVVSAIAEGLDPAGVCVGDICSPASVTVPVDATVGDAVDAMRTAAVRRVPVMRGSTPVGIVSLGDLSIEREPGSVLGQISSAPADTPNPAPGTTERF